MKRTNKNGRIIFCIYVNDISCIGKESAILKAIDNIEKIYSIKQKSNNFIGVNIVAKRNILDRPNDVVVKLANNNKLLTDIQ